MASSLKAYVNMTAMRQVLGSVILQPGLIKEHKIVQTDFVEPLHRLICPYEILIGLPSNLIRFSALRVGTLINNRLIARLAAT